MGEELERLAAADGIVTFEAGKYLQILHLQCARLEEDEDMS